MIFQLVLSLKFPSFRLVLSLTCPLNEAGKKVEAHVAKSPGLSLFRREEPVDGDSDESYALHNYRSTATRLIGKLSVCVAHFSRNIRKTRT